MSGFAAMGAGAFQTLVNNSSDAWGTGKSARNRQQQEEHNLYVKREREGIMARVEGAKAAGLHPLVGLGFQAGPGPVTHMGSSGSTPSFSESGDPPPPDTSDRTSDAKDPNIERYNAARARLAEAQATQAERELDPNYVAAQRRLATQPGNPPPLPTNPSNYAPGVKVEPNKVPAGRVVESGMHPAWADVEVVPGRKLRVASGKLKEALEDNELMSSLALLFANRHALGSYFTQDIPAALGYTGPRIKLNDPRARSKEKRFGPDWHKDYSIKPKW